MSIVSGSPPSAPASMGGLSSAVEDVSTGMSSLRFDGDSYLTRPQTGFANNKNSPWTFSVWIKKIQNGVNGGVFSTWARYNGHWQPQVIMFDGSDQLAYWLHDNGSGYKWNHRSTEKYRDITGWYHLMVTHDNSNAYAYIYINGKMMTELSISHNYATINGVEEHVIGSYRGNPGEYYSRFNGYMADLVFVDGEALTPESTGELISDVWRHKKYSGGYGVNGFHLDFHPDNMVYDVNGQLITVMDASGNDNHWQAH